MTTETLSKENIKFASKAKTLQHLSKIIKHATVPPILYFTLKEWQLKGELLLHPAHQWLKDGLTIIVRSSAHNEDSQQQSLAGHYTSVTDVKSEKTLTNAIKQVINSYKKPNQNDEVLIQPQICNCLLSGVAFNCNPNNGSPYYVINYDDHSGKTDTVTSGNHQELKQYVHHRKQPTPEHPLLSKVINCLNELSNLFPENALDIEFAIDNDETLFLLQARPLIVSKRYINKDQHYERLHNIHRFLETMQQPHPYLHGKQTIYGIMPDWNPAEIIGVYPKPLALTLYREVITDSVWAYQRDNYGYQNLRSFPLLVDLGGLPYIDVRVSFNSFLPKKLPDQLAEKLTNFYLDELVNKTHLHDKIEFEIVFSCYTLNLKQKLEKLKTHGFTSSEISTLFDSLIELTNSIIHNEHGHWKRDLNKIKKLGQRQHTILSSKLNPISKLYWIIEDCKRYGTLPFAGLARTGFIAMQILDSIVDLEVITVAEKEAFLQNISSVTTQMKLDLTDLDKNEFLEKYGHLRPGTYDITQLCYNDNFEEYFGNIQKNKDKNQNSFQFSHTQLQSIQKHLDEHAIEINASELISFITEAIAAREHSKFVFTKSISLFLELLADYCRQINLTREQCAFIDVRDILALNTCSINPGEAIRASINKGIARYEKSKSISLPPLITNPSQVYSYFLTDSEANFITQKQVTGSLSNLSAQPQHLSGTILMIPSADPGYDWVFSRKIAGLITQYGGANSHMAIRANELGIPAVIGTGELLYSKLKSASKAHIDCLNKQIRILY